GLVGIGVNPSYPLHVQKSFATGADARGVQISVDQSVAGVATLYGMMYEPTFSGSSGTLTGVVGLEVRPAVTTSGGTVSFMDGLSVWANVVSGATATNLRQLK